MCADLAQAAKTINYQRALQWELRLFVLRNGINPLVLSALHRMPRQGPREQVVPCDEFESVFSIASNRLRVAMLLARDAALRRSAIEAFSNANIDWDNGEIFGVTKNSAHYRVPMTHRLRAILAGVSACAEPGERFMAAMSRDRRAVKACTILWELKEAQRKQNDGQPMAWSMHDLRRTAARELYTKTKDIRKVQRLLGHASPLATWWYLGNAGQPLTSDDLEPITVLKPERRFA